MVSIKHLIPFPLVGLIMTSCGLQPAIHTAIQLTATPTGTPTPASAPLSSPTQSGTGNQVTPDLTEPASSVSTSTPGVSFPNLTGVWVDNGYQIYIDQSGYSAFASYIDSKQCDDRIGNVSPYPYDFSATLSQSNGNWLLTGKTIICSYGSDNPYGTGPKETDVRLVLSQDQNTLVGDWFEPLSGDWKVGGVNITRKFVNGAPAPTPNGFSAPTLTP